MPTFREALLFWLKLGFISFGGPAGQIAIMHRELVEKRKWISESHFLHALNFTMLLPGPEAQQLATYLGWRLHGWRGGVVAGGLFVIPSAILLFGLSWLYMAGQEIRWLEAVFHGLLAAVIAVILAAVLRIGKKTLNGGILWMIAIASFAAIYWFSISFVLIIASSALIGWLGHRFSTDQSVDQSTGPSEPGVLELGKLDSPSWRRVLMITGICGFLWLLPILLLGAWLGWSSTPVEQGVFFSKAAMVTFGGAYAVLPYVAQQAVEQHAWLSHGQMMSGLALAETTPGPLIIVLQFVGFVGGWQHSGALTPFQGAAVGAGITTWVTFVPCFLFVFLGGPFVERLQNMPAASAALKAITAAVVGVILNLGVEFTSHALWQKAGFNWALAVLSFAAFLSLWKFRLAFPLVLGACALVGLLIY